MLQHSPGSFVFRESKDEFFGFDLVKDGSVRDAFDCSWMFSIFYDVFAAYQLTFCKYRKFNCMCLSFSFLISEIFFGAKWASIIVSAQQLKHFILRKIFLLLCNRHFICPCHYKFTVINKIYEFSSRSLGKYYLIHFEGNRIKGKN